MSGPAPEIHSCQPSEKASQAPEISRARALVFSALMAAISVILSRFLSLRIPVMGTDALRFGMGGLPIIASGLILGPLQGAMTGACADLLGMALFPCGPYMPQFTLTAALTGLLPALMARYLMRPQGFWNFLIMVLVTQGITTCTLVPFFLMDLTQLSFSALAIPRLLALIFEAPFYAYLLWRLFTNRLVNHQS